MSVIKICDRCKKEIEPNAFYQTKGSTVDFKPVVGIAASYDLCGKCTRDFENFMKGIGVEGIK